MHDSGASYHTLTETWETTWMPHIQIDGLSEGVLFHSATTVTRSYILLTFFFGLAWCTRLE